ncbi:hypothetical protein [Streptomyces sp. NPDC046821]|uniref:hypothetical protein n=1 Tax=Streptomyces sp. NPDC046821 TaxID=3154702 RepID=UPI0034072883
MEQVLQTLAMIAFFSFIVGMFTLVIRAFIRSSREQDRIRKGWADLPGFAAARGWTHERSVPGGATEYCGVGPMPGTGSNLTAWHYITGEFRGRSFKCFEYRYVNPLSGDTQGGNRQYTHESVFLISAPGMGTPVMHMEPPTKIDRLMGLGPRMLLGVPDFDKKFRVDTRDEAFVRSVLTDDMRAFFLSDARAETHPLRLRDDELFTWYTGTLSPQEIEDRLNYLCDVMDRIPAQVWTVA